MMNMNGATSRQRMGIASLLALSVVVSVAVSVVALRFSLAAAAGVVAVCVAVTVLEGVRHPQPDLTFVTAPKTAAVVFAAACMPAYVIGGAVRITAAPERNALLLWAAAVGLSFIVMRLLWTSTVWFTLRQRVTGGRQGGA